jgi:probable HAF family extracellular repeat protein
MRELRIGDPDGTGEGRDINDAGQILAQATVGGYYHCYLISSGDALDVDAQTGLNIWPARLNDQGEFVGYVPNGFVTEAISWSSGVVRQLGFLEPGHSAFANDINNFGEAVGIAFAESAPPELPYYGVSFRNGGISVLGAFGPAAINDHGDIVGHALYSYGMRAVLYRAGTLKDLGILPDHIRSWAYAINDFGDILGYSEDAAERGGPFLYSGGVMHDLKSLLPPHSGWTLSAAFAMNDLGQIVGVGLFRGEERGFLLTPKGSRGHGQSRPPHK